MEKLLVEAFEAAKKDKKALILLKGFAVRIQNFQLAADLRSLEKELFPDSEEAKAAKKKGSEISTLFSMLKMNVNADVAWVVSETIRLHAKKKGKFDLKDAASLLAKQQEYFGDKED